MQPRPLLTTGTMTAVVLGLILGVLNTRKAEAQFNIAGIYIVARSPDEGPSRILKINSDGTLTSIQSTQLGLGVGDTTFSNQMGVWTPIGPQTIHAPFLILFMMLRRSSGQLSQVTHLSSVRIFRR